MNKRPFWILLALTAAGFALRLWKLSYGLPHIIFSDEGHHIYWALNMGGGDLNPHQFVHPTLFFYLCFAADCVYTLWGLATGLFEKAGDAWALYRRDPTVFYLIGRLWSVFFGAMTIPLVYLAGRKMFNTTVGLLGALFVTFSLLHVQYSQVAYLDVPLTFFIVLSFFFGYLGFENKKIRYCLCSGLAGGLATSIKYNGLGAATFGLMTSLLLMLTAEKGNKARIFIITISVFSFFFLLGFTIGTPYWIFDLDVFKRDILQDFVTAKTLGLGQLGYDGGRHWFYYLSNPLNYGTGWPIELAGIAGICLLVWKFRSKGCFFVSFPFAYFFIIGLSEIRAARYALPLQPFLCLAAACLVESVTSSVKLFASFKTRMIVVISCLLLVPSVLNVFEYSALRAVPDTRTLVARWMRVNIPFKSRVLISGYMFLPDYNSMFDVRALDSTLFDTHLAHHRSSLKSLAGYKKEGVDYLVLDEWHVGIVMEGADKRKYRDQFLKYEALIRDLSRAELVATFSPYREGTAKFDMENIDFPSRAIGNFKSMGPAVRIYKLAGT
jgi:hypothetical protein